MGFEFRKNNFDLIRLLAALQVAFVHGYQHFGIERGSWIVSVLSIFPGVPIFFVVSGFLISASLERSSSMTSYLQNRFLRIYPALWVCFIISIATVFALYDPKFTIVEFGRWTLAQLSIGQFFNPEFLRGYGVGVLNGSLWSIPVELQFYIFLPFIYMLFDKLNWNKYLIVVFISMLVIINLVYVNYLPEGKGLLFKLFGVTVVPYLYMFLFGFVLQRNVWFVCKFLESKVFFVLILYLVSVIIASFLGFNYQGNYINPASALILSLLVISMAYSHVEKIGGALKGNDISYGVYIYHMVFVNALLQVSLYSPVINQLIMIVLTIILAFFSWKLIEKPSLSLKKHSIKSL